MSFISYRSLIIILFLCLAEDLSAQNSFRSFNIGIVGGAGMGNNLYVESLGNERVLRPYLGNLSIGTNQWFDKDGAQIKEKYARQIGALLKFQSLGRNGNMWSLGITYTKTQVGYFMDNLDPFYWAQGGFTVDNWHLWIRYHSLFFHIQRSWAWKRSEKCFFYFKAAGGYSMLSEEIMRARRGLDDGITGSGEDDWINEGEGALFVHQVGEPYVLMAQPEIGIQFQMGRLAASHTLQFGISYNIPFEPLVRTEYIAFSNYQEFSRNRINFDGEHFALQASYSFPFQKHIRSGAPRRDREEKIMKRQRRRSRKGRAM